MKNFIKTKLKLLLEAASDYATKKDYYTTIFKMAKAKQLYGGDPYWENKEDGQFIASAALNSAMIDSAFSILYFLSRFNPCTSVALDSNKKLYISNIFIVCKYIIVINIF